MKNIDAIKQANAYYKKINMENEGLLQSEDFLKLAFPKNKKIYISGAISGVPHKNIDAFLKAENFITSLDCNAVNPLSVSDFIKDGSPWEVYMKNDIKHLISCDGVVVLDGWESSRGVAVEVFIAQQMKIPVFHFPSLEIFSYHFNLQKEKLNF